MSIYLFGLLCFTLRMENFEIQRIFRVLKSSRILDFLGNCMIFYFICFVYSPKQGKQAVKNCMQLRICWCTMVTYVRKSFGKYGKVFELLFSIQGVNTNLKPKFKIWHPLDVLWSWFLETWNLRHLYQNGSNIYYRELNRCSKFWNSGACWRPRFGHLPT